MYRFKLKASCGEFYIIVEAKTKKHALRMMSAIVNQETYDFDEA